MEDTIVKPGLYAYQFRVDVDDNRDVTQMLTFVKRYDVQHYIIGAEQSDLGKEHFQCIFWFLEKQNTTKLRNWWKGKTSDTKQPVSMTSARKIKSLAKYTRKENNFITNLTKEELESIGEWDPKVKEKEWALLLDAHAKTFDATQICEFDEMEYGNTTVKSHNSKTRVHCFIVHMLAFYRANYKRPSRATLQYLAWKHGHMDDVTLAQIWF
jgi:hypothetical protein